MKTVRWFKLLKRRYQYKPYKFATLLSLSLLVLCFQNCSKESFSPETAALDESSTGSSLGTSTGAPSSSGSTSGSSSSNSGSSSSSSSSVPSCSSTGTCNGDGGSSSTGSTTGSSSSVPSCSLTGTCNGDGGSSTTGSTTGSSSSTPSCSSTGTCNGDGGSSTTGSTSSTGTTTTASSGSTTININPQAVCGPTNSPASQSTLPNATGVIAVLYKGNFAFGSSGQTLVQAWDSASDVSSIRAQLAGMQPFTLTTSQALTAGTYSIVMYDASKVSAPYPAYTSTKSSWAVAPIEDTIASFLDSSSTFTINSAGQQVAADNMNVLVGYTTGPGFTPSAACVNAGYIDPLTINLSSAPIALTSQQKGVSMDLNGSGTMQQISWFSQPSVNMILVNVSGGMPANGAIGPAQIFGNFTVGPDGQVAANGYDALAKYDSNADGMIDSKDPIWSNLRVWQDLNHNGVADAGELLPLSQVNIVSIELPRTNNKHITKENCKSDQYGNALCQGHGAYVNTLVNGKASRQQMIDIGFKALAQ